VVWARGTASAVTCPQSYLSPESRALLEYYAAWRLGGAADIHELPARRIDAFAILEEEMRKESANAERG